MPLLQQPMFLNTGTGARSIPVNQRLANMFAVSVQDYLNCTGDGLVSDASPAFDAAIAALPVWGGTVIVPDALGYRLDTTIYTGTKIVNFVIGATTIYTPLGDHAVVLQSNGSNVYGRGVWATVFKHRAPTVPLAYPTVVTSRTGNVVTGAVPSGGSGLMSCPQVVVAANSITNASADSRGVIPANDAGIVATRTVGGSATLAIVAGGDSYTSDPAVTFMGGGHAAVMIDGVQDCEVCNFAVDFDNIPGTVGIYHRGGWYANVHSICNVYDVATGVSTESSTSIILVGDSYTLGVPGPTGSYGGLYVSQYSNIKGTRVFFVGHDTSTVTTLQLNTCSYQYSAFHGNVAVTLVNNVAQGAAPGYFIECINVDGLTIVGGDFEVDATWFHLIGACNGISLDNTLTFSGSGYVCRGTFGINCTLRDSKTNSTKAPITYGSGGTAGWVFQNAGWKIRHQQGINFSGDLWVDGSNLALINNTQGNLDDVSQAGFAITRNQNGALTFYTATAGANPRTITQFSQLTPAGMTIPAGGLTVGAIRVVGQQQPAVPNPTGGTVIDVESRTAISGINALLKAHGLEAP